MSNVVTLPTQRALNEAWEEYARLVRAANAERSLWADREHCEEMARAHRDWVDLFLCSDSKI